MWIGNPNPNDCYVIRCTMNLGRKFAGNTYWAYLFDVGPSGPNGVHVIIEWLVVLFSTTVTTSDIMAAGVAQMIARTQINSAVITVNGFVCESNLELVRQQITSKQMPIVRPKWINTIIYYVWWSIHTDETIRSPNTKVSKVPCECKQ